MQGGGARGPRAWSPAQGRRQAREHPKATCPVPCGHTESSQLEARGGFPSGTFGNIWRQVCVFKMVALLAAGGQRPGCPRRRAPSSPASACRQPQRNSGGRACASGQVERWRWTRVSLAGPGLPCPWLTPACRFFLCVAVRPPSSFSSGHSGSRFFPKTGADDGQKQDATRGRGPPAGLQPPVNTLPRGRGSAPPRSLGECPGAAAATGPDTLSWETHGPGRGRREQRGTSLRGEGVPDGAAPTVASGPWASPLSHRCSSP